jgi:phosphatidylglycerol:prolipoprotein diacylglycerol transferase
VIEFFRGDPRGTILNFLSTSQFICIFVLAAGIVLFIKAPAKKEADEEPKKEPEEEQVQTGKNE